jgi:hypothetical protein
MRDEAALLADAKRYLSKWQPRLHLSDWQIGVRVAVVDPDGCYANVEISWRYMTAEVRVRPDYDKAVEEDAGALCRVRPHDGDQLEQTIIHELAHLAEQPLCDLLREEVEAWIGTDGTAGQTFKKLWMEYREAWINRLSRVLTEADAGAWQ